VPIIVSPGGTVATPTSAVSSDGKITAYTDPAYAGILLSADFSSLTTKPVKVRFYRGSILVRSGDPAYSPGGLAVAYDHEAPLGEICSWTAVPIFADGTTGTASTPVALTTPSMSADVDCWVKPLADPGLSIGLEVHNDRIEEGDQARLDLTYVPGRAHPVGAFDVRTEAAMSITLRTDTKAEKDALREALKVGTVLVQLRSTYGIDDFYALPGDAAFRYFLGMFSPLRDVPVSFVPVDRPPTLDAPLFIPGRSYADQLQVAPTYAARLATWPTYFDALHGDYTPGDGLALESGGGGDEGSP